MKKFLLSIAAVSFALGVYADDEVYNFFDPEDCDEAGWLWLDSQEKIDKYVGDLSSGKKILLVPADYEIDDPEFPGETIPLVSVADPNVKGYNTLGVEGGEGAKVGGIILPPSVWGDWWDDMGGGFMVAMPDCASFEVYMSQKDADVYTELDGALIETNNPADCKYIWDYCYDYNLWEYVPLSAEYVATDVLTNEEYKYTYGGTLDEPEETVYQIYGAKDCGGRTAYYMNYGESCDLIIHGLKVFTYTDVSSDTAVKGIEADEAAAPVYFNLQGVKVANPDKGIFIVKEGNKARKVVL